MKAAKILLLYSNSSDYLSQELYAILNSSSSPILQLYREPISARESAFCEKHLSNIISNVSPDLIFVFLPLRAQITVARLFQSIRGAMPDALIIVVLEEGDPGETFELLKLWASDFITLPLKSFDILPRAWRLLEHNRRTTALTHSLKEKLGLKNLIGESATLRAEIEKISPVTRCDASVLISGESGTGKELFARAIHYLSPRSNKPFVPVTCGAIPVDLIESELFGHERGAFTGASTSQVGLVQEAEGGTIFLDEVDCTPLLAQVKLLRFLQEKEYRPLGSAKTRKANVRVISATNIVLEDAVREGKLRQDLYYRLNIVPLKLPPLRERREDIPLLASHFLAKYATEFNKDVRDFTAEAMAKLALYQWPGNVRELQHTIERAVALSNQEYIRGCDLLLSQMEDSPDQESLQEAKANVVRQFEKTYIQSLLRTHNGNITKAAQAARKNRRAFWQLIRKYQIDPQMFKSGGS